MFRFLLLTKNLRRTDSRVSYEQCNIHSQAVEPRSRHHERDPSYVIGCAEPCCCGTANMPQPAEILFSDTPCSPLHGPWHSSSGIPSNTSFTSTVVHGSEWREQNVGTMNGQGCDRKVGKREEANLENRRSEHRAVFSKAITRT